MRRDAFGDGIQVGRYVGSPTVLSLSVVTASVQLKPQKGYRLTATVDSAFKFGPSTVSATTTDHPLWAKIDTLHYTDTDNFWIAGIVASGTGVLFISELDVSGN